MQWQDSRAPARTAAHLRIHRVLGPLTIEPTLLSPSSIDFAKLDDDAVRATQRLAQRGFEAYLVGGCVRDLLLGHVPKDYDIATAARPQQVKRTFPRNCRIIGRRFKLAHLHFHGNTKILEVSTFRRSPQAESNELPEGQEADLLIRQDNEFGNAQEDALRRDFTVNALFLDVSDNCILDYANGLEDLRNRTIRTIGDPRVRFREDPVRILRAAKFAARLSFHVEPETLAAMAETAPDLVRAAPPRLLEEILRLLRSGHALESFQLLRDVGALKSLVPVLADWLARADHPSRVRFWRILEALDHRVAMAKAAGSARGSQGHRGFQGPNAPQGPTNGVLLGALLLCPVLDRCEKEPHTSPSTIAEELLGPLSVSLRLPRRDSGCLKRICGVAHRFLQLDDPRRFQVQGFAHSPYFDEALELFELRAEATGLDPRFVLGWREIAQTARQNRGHGHFGEGEGEFGDDERAQGEPAQGDRAHRDRAYSDRAHDAGEPATTSEATGDRPDTGGDAFGDDRGGRRRRRRRRRGRHRDDESQGPHAHDLRRDPNAPRDDEHPHTTLAQPDPGYGDGPLDEPHEDGPHGPGEEAGPEAAGATDTAGAERGDLGARDGSRRRRRRRRRRGRDRDDLAVGGAPFADEAEGQATPDGQEPASDAGVGDESAGGHPAHAEQGPHRQGHAQRGQRHDDRGHDGRGQEGRGHPRDQQGQRNQQGQRQQQQQQGQQPHGRDRNDRQSRRDRRKGRGRRDGAPRDVDVVPRGVDRRGKVDVIEPPPLDLTAFDIELDPKRVPTFGSIVEGKNRPKRRPPRLPDEGRDDYKPPPPPGQDDDPVNAPPPPADDAPSGGDTFGDW